MAKKESLIREFENPGAAYRGKPFWAWNGKLEETELRRQIRIMRQMGLGGAFMHSRVGLATPYLSPEWFRLIEACVDECAKNGMEAWLYDEDRWPSGAGGGLVTKDPKHRCRSLRCELMDAASFNVRGKDVLAVFTGKLEGDRASEVRRITPVQAKKLPADRCAWVFHVVLQPCSSWYNDATYLDTMNHEAVRRFIQVTHEAYRRANGRHFGKTIPGMFTDEPNYGNTNLDTLPKASGDCLDIPWTAKLPVWFKKRYGYEVVDHLPELFFDVDGLSVNPARWHYHDCTTFLFTDAFARQIGEWCAKNKLQHTGHVLEEPTPSSQTSVVGSAMRFYEHMQVPGVDILCESNAEYDTVKQTASVLRQMGRKWLLSEVYGCTGWQFNFESHKAVGDWQAALGVNLRCHHLAWYTMAGEAKRDYPASISYQSPWWSHYAEVEDYFARVHVAMTRGEPVRDVLVIHPIESTWVRCRAGWRQSLDVQTLDSTLASVRDALLDAQIDFDYGDEEMLSRLGRVAKTVSPQPASLKVGKASYRVVVVPPMLTIRSTTVALLRKFREAGGTVVFVGQPAEYVDAVKSSAASDLAEACAFAPLAAKALAAAVDPAGRVLSVTDGEGMNLSSMVYMLRRDGDVQWLFLVNRDRKKDYNPVHVRLRGAYVEEWDPHTGNRFGAETTQDGDHVTIITSLPAVGSRLFAIRSQPVDEPAAPRRGYMEVARETLAGGWGFHLDEPNVLVLDKPQLRIGGSEWLEPMEVLKADQVLRSRLGLPRRGGAMVQPWARCKGTAKPVPIALRYTIDVDDHLIGPLWLAIEAPDRYGISVNGGILASNSDDGWWVDRSIRRVRLDPALLHTGRNDIVMSMDFTEDDNLEASFLLGAFGVWLDDTGDRAKVAALPYKLQTKDWCGQGLPFYAGSVGYRQQVRTQRQPDERVFVALPKWAGSVVRVLVSGRPVGYIKWSPYELDITDAIAGETIDLGIEVIGHRHNAFGPLHQAPPEPEWFGPDNFITEGARWQEAYNLYPVGLLAPPVISVRT